MDMRTVGKYKLIEQIGHGASGKVYLAQDVNLPNRQLAVKLIEAEPEDLKHFIEEAQIMDDVHHPHIVHVRSVDVVDPKTLLIGMEYVPGGSLHEHLFGGTAKCQVAVETAIKWTCQVLDGLAFAHYNGVIHGDIRPGNILLTEANDVKIADFGASRRQKDGTGGRASGNYDYRSPDWADTLDFQSDLWSVGLMFYRMITGSRPFEGGHTNDPSSWQRAMLTQTPQPLNRYVKDIPRGLQQIVDKALAKNKKEQFGSAEEFMAHLDALGIYRRELTDEDRWAIGSMVVTMNLIDNELKRLIPEDDECRLELVRKKKFTLYPKVERYGELCSERGTAWQDLDEALELVTLRNSATHGERPRVPSLVEIRRARAILDDLKTHQQNFGPQHRRNDRSRSNPVRPTPSETTSEPPPISNASAVPIAPDGTQAEAVARPSEGAAVPLPDLSANVDEISQREDMAPQSARTKLENDVVPARASGPLPRYDDTYLLQLFLGKGCGYSLYLLAGLVLVGATILIVRNMHATIPTAPAERSTISASTAKTSTPKQPDPFKEADLFGRRGVSELYDHDDTYNGMQDLMRAISLDPRRGEWYYHAAVASGDRLGVKLLRKYLEISPSGKYSANARVRLQGEVVGDESDGHIVSVTVAAQRPAALDITYEAKHWHGDGWVSAFVSKREYTAFPPALGAIDIAFCHANLAISNGLHRTRVVVAGSAITSGTTICVEIEGREGYDQPVDLVFVRQAHSAP